MHKSISLLTIVHGRQNALRNLLNGVAEGSLFPMEVVIVHMNEQPLQLDNYPFAIRQVLHKSQHGLNLAAARNFAMLHSQSPKNVFLDVDCIPERTLIAQYAEALDDSADLISGRVRYLSQKASEELHASNDLFKESTPDPVRPENKPFVHELFWTLNFGCNKETFRAVGGFDENYSGYGGEDTDFAFTARAKGIGLKTIDATAFHQYHPSYSPPLNHLQDIIHNATVFYNKWDKWPMEGWLKAFLEKGFIEETVEGLRIKRLPTASEIQMVKKL
ncbi:glycosyltransferase family 2 protein [Sphingobacterium deserti]|uniref:Glycosyl transferase n=1 Tax=Sphingobacterium deserti TaxID=1229276 RepID=A0A0B8T100_9SPHI|nr:galactosyltransferase-related protein [Sphingobacterium deserti]KGE12298.1 glycosyl transferase [Sphingobacterium deserti]